MKLTQSDLPLLFSETVIPDIFFAEYLSQMPATSVKVYLYIIFLSKYEKDAKLNDLSKNLALPLKDINDAFTYLEENGFIIRKENGFIISNLQEQTLNKLYKPNLTMSPEKVADIAKNKARAKIIEHINNTYFSGIMGPSWYNNIDIWLTKYNFDDQVLISLFDYCFRRSALNMKYVQTVAEAWGSNKIQTWEDLDSYYQKQDALVKIKKTIAKKLGKQTLTQYEEAYIEKWLLDYGYNLNIIEIALKRSVYKSNPTFEYFNNIITNWHERGLKTPEEVYAFIEQREKQRKDTKQLEKQVNKASYEQRQYSNLSFLYANSNMQTNTDNQFQINQNPNYPNVAASNIQGIEGDINV
ncbi:MAG TPA: DNA replication protein DnaD [Clostridiales bacterium]|jgi:DnaD/phage-associated family protein|nr:DNA replication protein DnaD [Clostridiales bacterium]